MNTLDWLLTALLVLVLLLHIVRIRALKKTINRLQFEVREAAVTAVQRERKKRIVAEGDAVPDDERRDSK